MPPQGSPNQHASSSTLPLHSDGIYRNLPTFPDTHSGYTALITGANGISGFATLRVLLQSPKRWTKIYALSRRPPPKEMMSLLTADQRSRVQHVAVDFLESPEKIAAALKSANVSKADYCFFYSYLQPAPPPGSAPWSNAQELVDVNSALLRNFLGALDQTNLIPKRFVLQTGAKNYGAHLGTIRAPAVESDPQPKHLEPNFYYPQEDLLTAFCARHGGVGWNVIRPAWILGAVNNAAMNALHPFAIYAAVCKERGVEMKFPGSWAAWQGEPYHSTAINTGYLTEWAALEDGCKDQAFNATDSSPLPWNRAWPEIGRWFGVEEKMVGKPVWEDDGSGKLTTMTLKEPKDTPLGYGPAPTMTFAFSMLAWAADPANAEAWKKIQKAHPSVTADPFADIEANFTFGDGAFMGMPSLCMNKARRMGWTGFVDTTESLFQMYDEMGKLGMLPPMVERGPKAFV